MELKSSERWQQIDSHFSGALPLSRDARRQYLDAACGDDAGLRAEVQQLLDASEASGTFLDKLDVTAAARLLETSGTDSGLIGRYKVISKVGAGGMGIVYLAEDPSLKRFVAVKLLPMWFQGSARANRRLLEEARAASSIDHPNIATVHEIGETEDGRLFIAMTYYEGETLRDHIARTPPTIDSAIEIALQIARGLAAAHRKGIIHRDIKPENVLISADGMVKIVDFGLAGIEVKAHGGSPAGTAAYMSPEQALGAPLDARTDIWSLGVILYEMLAGERPYSSLANDAILRSTRNDHLTMNASIGAAPEGLKNIVQRCLKKDQASRYSSVDRLIEDLEAVRNGAGPGVPQRPETVRHMAAKRRARVVGATAVVTLAAIGTAAAWRNAREATSPAGTSPPVSAAALSGPRMAAAEGSIAVLPFVDMSPKSDGEHLSDGLTEELISALAGIDRLRVIARTSVFHYKGKPVDVREAGTKLGVVHILEGSVRSSGGRLRVVVRLVDAKRGHEVWSQVFDRSDNDLFAVQAEIARSVASALRVELAPIEQASLTGKSNPDAHALYLKGRRLFHQRTELAQAVTYFREAIAIEPDFTRAWNGLARTWLIMPVYSAIPFPQARDSAEAAIGKALALDPNLADAHATRGSMLADAWHWADSEPHFVRALELNGGDATSHQWYGEFLLRTGRLDEAIARLRFAEQLDPLLSVIPMNLGWAFLASDRDQEALASFRDAIALDPRDVQAHVGIGYVLVKLRRFSEAMPAFETAVALTNGQRSTRSHLARAYALAGMRPVAMNMFNDMKVEAERGAGSAFGVALVAVSLGLEDEAFRWLELGYQRREIGMGFLKTSEGFKPLRSDPRFRRLLGKIGL